jgi:hypothetical protein
MRPGLAAPARQVFANLGRALATAGAGPRRAIPPIAAADARSA